MQYKVKVNDKEVTIDVEKQESGYTFSIDGRHYEVQGHRLDAHQIRTSINGKHHPIFVHSHAGTKQIAVQGINYDLEDATRVQRRSSKSGNSDEVTPPMPGAIIRVLVSPGDTVEADQELVVMSAMKMETTLYAPFAAKVKDVLVAEGDQVMPGQQLVDLEQIMEEASEGDKA